MDKNGDGSISRLEMVKAISSQQSVRDLLHLGAIGESRLGASQKGAIGNTKALFAKLDSSGDGQITAEEFHESVIRMHEVVAPPPPSPTDQNC